MNLLENSKLVFLFFILLGFVLPQAAEHLQEFLIPLLIVMMTYSIRGVHLGHMNKTNFRRAVFLLLTNFFILTPLLVVLANLLVADPMYLYGFIILASVPPAIGIIPLVHLYHGDMKDSILGEIVCYLFALVFSPLLVYFLLGENLDITYFVKILALLILTPILLSWILHRARSKLLDAKTVVVNLVYGISFYIFIGLNREIFLNDWQSLLPVAAVISFVTFGLGFIVYEVLRRRKVRKPEDIMYVLFATFKNGNGAATIALLFFGPAAAIPVAVRGVLMPLYFVFLEWLFRRHRKAHSTST